MKEIKGSMTDALEMSLRIVFIALGVSWGLALGLESIVLILFAVAIGQLMDWGTQVGSIVFMNWINGVHTEDCECEECCELREEENEETN